MISALTNVFPQKLSFSISRPSTRTILIFGFLLIVSLLVFYIYQVNEMTKASYLLSKYQGGLAKLSQENKTLELTFSQTNSLATMERLLKDRDYEKVGKIFYIRLLDGTAMSE